MRREQLLFCVLQPKSMDLVIWGKAGPGNHYCVSFGFSLFFVSMLGLEAYFLCEHLTRLRMSSVWQGACHTRTCSHGAPWSSAPYPSALFTFLPSPFFHLSQAFPVSIPELKRAQRIRVDSAVEASFPKGAL